MSKLKLGTIILVTLCVGFVAGVLGSVSTKSTVQESSVKQEIPSPTPVASSNITTEPEKTSPTVKKSAETTKTSPVVKSNPSYTAVFTFSGDGAKKSEPFTITGSRFKIKYNCNGDICQAFLYKAGGNMSGLIMNKAGSTSDETIFYGAGQYYIDANTMGSYSMTVEDFK